MSTIGRLQKLLKSEEYSEFNDENIILESQFIEMTHKGEPIKTVIAGITEKFFIVANDVISDLRKSRASVLVADVDTDTVDLELEWVVPIVHVIPEPVPNEHVLDVRGHNEHHRYYMVSITRSNGSESKIWTKWMKHLAKSSPTPDQFLGEIPKFKLKNIFHKDKASSGEVVVKTSVIDNIKSKTSSIIKSPRKQKKNKSSSVIRPIDNKLPRIMTDLYDTTGIIKEKNSLLCCCPRKKKRVKD
ncbi:uncharacterized protein LOC133202355 [Saccostrea echinata]|uniref:uncharacterized protein LOC133202355 n=1 Tax=Saccostrea echinata TaxID=191078 RepID=UPI002A836511|nr:uncharacterized protein LOC133202355 [Saccostrea echinata]